MMLVSMPPTTAKVANVVKGINGPYDFIVLMYGAHKNHARAQTDAENCRVFCRSVSTSSDVHVVNMDNDDDVAILMARHGNISRATICVKYTGGRRSGDKLRPDRKKLLIVPRLHNIIREKNVTWERWSTATYNRWVSSTLGMRSFQMRSIRCQSTTIVASCIESDTSQ